jgi:hypothetical protein
MMLPGLISLAFYNRRPTRVQVWLGLLPTVMVSAVLGAVLAPGPLSRTEAILAAAVSSVALYGAILPVLGTREPRAAAARAVGPMSPPLED